MFVVMSQSDPGTRSAHYTENKTGIPTLEMAEEIADLRNAEERKSGVDVFWFVMPDIWEMLEK